MPQRRRTAPCRGVLALALAAVASRTQAQVSLLRAPGSSTDDGQFLVGGLSASGRAAFLAQYSPVFTTYLNAALGTALGRTFVTVALNDAELLSAAENSQLDFVFTYPSQMTCLDSQFHANAIATVQSLRRAPTPPYAPVNVSHFGGVFFALANRTDINSLADLAGKRLEGADVTSLGAAQSQWHELEAHLGYHFWNLPAQVLFSHDQYAVVADVAAGVADVGMVRTDYIDALELPEPYCNATAQAAVGLGCFPPGTFKVLNARTYPGYPFQSSTELYPEWPVAALPHVDYDTQKLVAEALFALGPASPSTLQYTTPARINTFTPPLSYMPVRDVQYIQNWIRNETCIASTNVYDTIVCFDGTFKLSAEAVAGHCAENGFSCPAGYDCVCLPCDDLPPEPISVYIAPQASPGNATQCAELETCVTIEQTQPIILTLVDDWFLARAELGLPALQRVSYRYDDALTNTGAWTDSVMAGARTWNVTLPTPHTGLVLLELRVDGVALDISPLLVSVVPPTCTGGAEATVDGACICPTDTEPRGEDGACLPIVVTIPVLAIAVGTCVGGSAVILLAVGIAYTVHRRNEALWRIPASAITHPESVEVLGRGTFGLVVKGQYRGTQVALKRSLPVEPVRGSSRSGGVSLLRFRGSGGGSSTSGNSGSQDVQAVLGGGVGGSEPTRVAPPATTRVTSSGSGTLPSILSRTASIGTRSAQGSGTLPALLAQAGTQGRGGAVNSGLQSGSGAEVRSTLLVASSVTSADRNSLDSRSSLEHRGSLERQRAAAGSNRKSQFDMPEHDEEKGGVVPASCTVTTSSGTRVMTTNTHSTSQQSSYLPGPCATRFPFLELILSTLHRRRRAAALRRDFINEMRLLVHLRHPHILTVLGAVLQDSEPILVSELMDRGSLHDLLHNETLPLDGTVVCRLLRDIASGMLFLHSADPPILHNDLKSANVLVDASFRAKVSDFGLSGKRRASRGPPGTPFWMAPELLRRHRGGRRHPGGQPSTATDVYSFGITLSEVFNRAEPYSESPLTAHEILSLVVGPAQRNKDDPPPLRPVIAESVPPAFADLMRRCWHAEPLMRPNMAGIAAELRLASNADSDTIDGVTTALVEVKKSRKGERDLLHSVFPAAVAAALAAGRRVEPQHFDCVTVFFCDITGFTDISSRLPPIKVMRMLERLYTEFDALTNKHSLFKVETIGDAYMVCGALNDGQEHDHVARIAAFAADAIVASAKIMVDEEDPSSGFITIRAGFHCGPVVASVVGRTNPRYCLFGDTVNTASRMESNSAPGRVTLSPEAAALLQQQAPSVVVTSRGQIPIKGKGTMELFYLDKGPHTREVTGVQPPTGSSSQGRASSWQSELNISLPTRWLEYS